MYIKMALSFAQKRVDTLCILSKMTYIYVVFTDYCPAGFYIDGQSCKGCPKGTYKPQENYYNESCTKCPPEKNHTTNVNSTSEGDCRLG